MTREQILLTPEVAAELLANPHPKQRSVVRQRSEPYGRAMRENRGC